MDGCLGEMFAASEIQKAWMDYQLNGPRTKSGRLYKPDAGALHRLIVNARPKAPRQVEPEPEPINPISHDRAVEILKEHGARFNRFGGVVSLKGAK